jgi:hypothetical protein
MSLARPDEQRTWFRRPLRGGCLGLQGHPWLGEIVVGVLLAVPSFDPQATFAG